MRYGKVNLMVSAILADDDDSDSLPERIPLTGTALCVPKIITGYGNVGEDPTGSQEVQLPLPVPCTLVDGALTYEGLPHVTLLSPTGGWEWEVRFNLLAVDDRPLVLEPFRFPVVEHTAAELADDSFAGVNIAQFAAEQYRNATPGAVSEANILEMLEIQATVRRSVDEAEDQAQAAADSAAEALSYRNSAQGHASNATAKATAAGQARDAAVVAQGLAETARAAAETARDAAQTARTGAEGARDAAQTARTGAETARDAAQTARTGAEGARDAAQDHANTAATQADIATTKAGEASAARTGAEGARDAAAVSETNAGQSASDADGHRAAAAASETNAGQSASDADAHRVAAEGHAGDAATALSGAEDARDLAQQARQGAEDERVVAQDAAVLAEGHAQAADGHRVDAEAAAALAQSLRWVVRGAWEPGAYEAGDVVVYDERAYYAQTATSAQPPAQPWVPLTPAGGGASHWDELDGKPTLFPPEAHTHDAADVSGAATPLLDVTEASVGAQSVGEALGDLYNAFDSKSNVGHTHTTADVTGLDSALAGKADAGAEDTATWSGVSGKPATFPPTIGSTASTAKAGNYQPTWAQVTSKPSTFAPSAHTHAITDVTGLQTALDGKVGTSDSRLSDARTPTAHTHTTTQVTGLDTALAGKASTSHTHTPASLGAVARSGSAVTLWSGTQAQYDALAPATRNAAGFVAVIT